MFDPASTTSADPEELLERLEDLAKDLQDLDPHRPTSPEVPGVIARFEQFRAVLDGASLALLGRCDADGLHETDGLMSTRSWLKHHTRASGDTAARRLRLARDLRSLPLLADALRHGCISMDAARIVCAARRPSLEAQFDLCEAMFVEWAEQLHIDDLTLAVRRWVELTDDAGTDPEKHWKDRNLWLSQTLGGSWQLRGRLTPEGGARLHARLNALAASARRGVQPGDAVPTPAQLAADALVRLAADPPGPRRRSRTRLTVLTSVDDLRLGLGARLSTGEWVDGAAIARLACDAEIMQAYTDAAGRLLNAFSAGRFPDARLRAALMARYPTCVVPGCDVPASECDMHHVVPWALGGPTDVTNVRPFCDAHHSAYHRESWVMRESVPDRTTVSPLSDSAVRYPPRTPAPIQIHRPGRPPLSDASRWDRCRSPGPTAVP